MQSWFSASLLQSSVLHDPSESYISSEDILKCFKLYPCWTNTFLNLTDPKHLNGSVHCSRFFFHLTKFTLSQKFVRRLDHIESLSDGYILNKRK